MILTAKSGARGLLVDLDTGRPVRKVISANLTTGEYEAYRTDADGNFVCDPLTGKPRTYKARARLKFTPTVNLVNIQAQNPPQPAGTPADGARAALAPHNAATGRPGGLKREPRRKARRLKLPLFDRPCEHYGCARLADWAVSDEVNMPPVPGTLRGRRVLFPRARTVGVHWWCAFHYEAPRILDDKGEVVSTWAEAGGVRPQWHS